jgi:3-dehydroquinate synthase
MPDATIQPGLIHRLRITRDVFDAHNPCLRSLIGISQKHRPRLLPVFDEGLLDANPGLRIRAQHAIATLDHVDPLEPVLIPGGETCKTEPAVFDFLLEHMDRVRLCRHSFVLVIGGGAVLDAAGFAASIIHRGVRLIRIPTTSLSQDDSGVGVKSGINRFGKKNMLGCFSVPWGVINDVHLLDSLPDQHYFAGFSEAIKVALIRDADLFDRIEHQAEALRARDHDVAEDLITRSAELHLRHIAEGGDPFETTTARPLDFGHWAAHKLEQLSGFTLPHGEAVSIGLAIDTMYAAEAGLCDASVPERTIASLRCLGLPTTHPLLTNTAQVLDGLEDFREHLGGVLTLSMPTAIGTVVEINEVDRPLMMRVVRTLAQEQEQEQEPAADGSYASRESVAHTHARTNAHTHE